MAGIFVRSRVGVGYRFLGGDRREEVLAHRGGSTSRVQGERSHLRPQALWISAVISSFTEFSASMARS